MDTESVKSEVMLNAIGNGHDMGAWNFFGAVNVWISHCRTCGQPSVVREAGAVKYLPGEERGGTAHEQPCVTEGPNDV